MKHNSFHGILLWRFCIFVLSCYGLVFDFLVHAFVAMLISRNWDVRFLPSVCFLLHCILLRLLRPNFVLSRFALSSCILPRSVMSQSSPPAGGFDLCAVVLCAFSFCSFSFCSFQVVSFHVWTCLVCTGLPYSTWCYIADIVCTFCRIKLCKVLSYTTFLDQKMSHVLSVLFPSRLSVAFRWNSK